MTTAEIISKVFFHWRWPLADGFLDYEECIWSTEEFTFESSNLPLYPHQNNGIPFLIALFLTIYY